MPDKVSRRVRKRVERFFEALDNIGKIPNMVKEEDILDLFRRAAISVRPDGFPQSSIPEATSGGGHSDSTFSSAHSRLKTAHIKDPVKEQAKQVETLALSAEETVIFLIGALQEIGVKLEQEKQRKVTEPCEICHELSSEKSGMCNKDHTNWTRHGRPDRQRWRQFLREERNSEGLLLVETCPPPSPGAKVTRGPWKSV